MGAGCVRNGPPRGEPQVDFGLPGELLRLMLRQSLGELSEMKWVSGPRCETENRLNE